MAITTYAELQTAVANWLNRSQATAMIPDFITLTEERMNRALRVREMETALAATTISSAAISVPANTIGVKTLWVTGYERNPLRVQNYVSLLQKGTSGLPTGYAWQGSNFYFDGAGEVKGVLYSNIPALSAANTTNWLLTAHPSAYLRGALSEAFNWTRNAPERDYWNALFEKSLADIHMNDQRSRFSGPLQVRTK